MFSGTKYFINFSSSFKGSASWLSILGASFSWMWIDRAIFGDTLFLDAPREYISFAFFLSLLASAVVLGVLAFRPLPYTRKSVFSRLTMIVLGVLGVLAGVMVMIAVQFSLLPLLYIGSVLLGIDSLTISVVWGIIVIADGPQRAFLNITGALSIGLLFNSLIEWLLPGAREIIVLITPFVSMMLYLIDDKLQSEKRYMVGTYNELESRTGKTTNPTRIAVVVLVLCLSFGFMYGSIIFPVSGESLAGPFDAIKMRGLTALVFFIIAISPLRKYFFYLVVAFILLLSMGMVMISIQLLTNNLQAEPAFIISVGYAVFDIAVWLLLAAIGNRSSYQNAKSIALILCAQQFGILGGQVIAGALELVQPNLDTVVLLVPLYVFLLASLAIIRLCYETIDMTNLRPKPSPRLTDANSSDSLSNALQAFSNRYELTQRESEIIGYITQGRSVPYIAQTLVLSENTIKTHLRHVYVKCNVKNRQALLDLFSEQPEQQ